MSANATPSATVKRHPRSILRYGQMTSRPILAALFVGVCGVLGSPSRPTHLYGIVIQGGVGQPIHEARVTLFAPETDKILDSTLTDSFGRFRLSAQTSPGCHLITVRAIGYSGTDRSLALTGDGRFDIGVVLMRQFPIPEELRLYMKGCSHPLGGRWSEMSADSVQVPENPPVRWEH